MQYISDFSKTLASQEQNSNNENQFYFLFPVFPFYRKKPAFFIVKTGVSKTIILHEVHECTCFLKKSKTRCI